MRLFGAFVRIGLFSFSAAASALIMEWIVDRRQWLTTEEFRDKLSLAAIIPGPFHVNLVGLIGYALGGYLGLLLSLIGFVLPGFVLAVVLAVTLSSDTLGRFLVENPGAVKGMLLAVGALLLNVVVRIGRFALPAPSYWAWVAGLSVVLLVKNVHFALVILGAGLLHVLYLRATRAY